MSPPPIAQAPDRARAAGPRPPPAVFDLALELARLLADDDDAPPASPED